MRDRDTGDTGEDRGFCLMRTAGERGAASGLLLLREPELSDDISRLL